MKNCLKFKEDFSHSPFINHYASKKNNIISLEAAIDKELTQVTLLQEQLDKHEQILLELMAQKNLLVK